jgi:CrcB protein
MTTVLVALFGAVGVVVRYRLGMAVGTRTFPWTTLAINVSGTFALAALVSWAMRMRVDSMLVTALSVGLLGGYTTFSTFGWETFSMLRDGRVAVGLAYVLSSVALTMLAAWLGYIVIGPS